MNKRKLLVICGGQSTEHSVSRMSCTSVYRELDKNKYELTLAGIDQMGQWYILSPEQTDLTLPSWLEGSQKVEDLYGLIKSFDVVFPVLHGMYGEDGTIQGLLELAKVPYVGCRVLGSSVSMDMMNSLNGKIAGAVINSSASGIGGATRVVLRGLKSISSSNNALYVVDGIPLFNNNNGEIKSEFESQPRGEGLTDLNPDDIESMTVLTGPSAAALYGSSAANGVIVITTKKGKTGRPQISFSNQTTFSSPLKMPEFPALGTSASLPCLR